MEEQEGKRAPTPRDTRGPRPPTNVPNHPLLGRRGEEKERERGREGGPCSPPSLPFPPCPSLPFSPGALTGLHKQAWIPTLPAGEMALLGQGEHEPLPAATLYVPVHQGAASREVSTRCCLSSGRREVSKAWFDTQQHNTRQHDHALSHNSHSRHTPSP